MVKISETTLSKCNQIFIMEIIWSWHHHSSALYNDYGISIGKSPGILQSCDQPSVSHVICLCSFLGPRCEFSEGACDSGPCLNGGECQEDGTGGFLCVCQLPFAGWSQGHGIRAQWGDGYGEQFSELGMLS